MSPSYRVKFAKRAKHELAKLSQETKVRVVTTIEDMARNPYLHFHKSLKKLRGVDPRQPVYSLRIGYVRIILTIHDDASLIYILEIDQRKIAYRDF